MEIQPSSNAGIRRYGLAFLAGVCALLLRRALAPMLGSDNAYHTAWLAVVFSAWYCGVGPAILTVLLDLVGIWYWFLPPNNSFHLLDPKTAFSGMLGFAVFSCVIIALGEGHRRALAKSQWAEEELRNAQRELERKVEQRTSELSRANENLRELSGRLQQLRDEERRHLARELHDSVGQMLAALSMNLAKLRTQADRLDPAATRALIENVGIVDQITKEIRTISHLLHPPLLDVAGLASAIRWYVDGFSERSKIKVNVEIPADVSRLSNEMEITIFRLVQECLTNIHRHSGSETATIVIREEDDRVVVEIKDAGTGISLEKQLELSSDRTGVGFRGMRERLRQLGGNLDIQSDTKGTSVKANLPIRPPADAALEQERAS